METLVSSCGHVDTLIGDRRGPFFGPVAHAGQETRDSLRESWGIGGPAEWREQVDYLLTGENVGPETDHLLHLRRDMIGRYGRCDLPMWRDAIARWAQWKGTTPEEARQYHADAGVITRYEARFRADGLLPPGGLVNSVLGYDFGRAVNMARWGFGSTYCDYGTAESIILRAGKLARQYYMTWPDFGAGYALGRVLRFDNEEYGHMYESVLGPHLMLIRDPASPWRNIPFS
jgi:hypothetical protein